MTTVLAIDQGTTNSKALLVDQSGKVLAQGSAPMGVHATSGGRVEQDADEVWASTCAAIEACLAGRPAPDAVAISNQRESVLVWRRDSGRAAGPVLGWQDTRTAAWCRDHQSDDRLVRQQTGLPLDSMFSAPKLRWLLDQVGGGDDLAAGTIDSWLVHGSPAAPSMPPMRATRRARCCSTWRSSTGPTSCVRCSAFPGRCCRRSGAAMRSSA